MLPVWICLLYLYQTLMKFWCEIFSTLANTMNDLKYDCDIRKHHKNSHLSLTKHIYPLYVIITWKMSMTSMMTLILIHCKLKNHLNMLHSSQLWLRDLTSFKPFQKNVITTAIEGNDALVVQAIGSCKSSCFLFHLFI